MTVAKALEGDHPTNKGIGKGGSSRKQSASMGGRQSASEGKGVGKGKGTGKGKGKPKNEIVATYYAPMQDCYEAGGCVMTSKVKISMSVLISSASCLTECLPSGSCVLLL